MRNNKEEKRHTAAGKMTNSERDFKQKLNDLQICDISLPVVSIGQKQKAFIAHWTTKVIILQVKSEAVMCD